MQISDFDYELPAGCIAERPLPERDASRMLVLDRASQSWQDSEFRHLPEQLRGDELLVVNNARVIPARLFGRRAGLRAEPPGRHSRARREHLMAEIEVLLARQVEPGVWEALVRPGRKVPVGERVIFGAGELEAEVIGRGEYGVRTLRLSCAGDLATTIDKLGHVPLPPYIDRADEPQDRERYQTVFARRSGAVAAPTAGLHFTPGILERLKQRGVEVCEITLEVGLGTFQPIHVARVEDHEMHTETYEISDEVARRIEKARAERRPIVAVGTTVVRALEDAAAKSEKDSGEPRVRSGRAAAGLFIYPGFLFRVVNQMLTNFHLPRSSLLVMVSAFAGRELVLKAYGHAIRESYRFYSYGDCMLIR